MGNNHNYWKLEEIEILKEHYAHSTFEELSKMLPGRNRKGITIKAARLGLRKTEETAKRIREIFGENQKGPKNHQFGKRYKRKTYPCVVCGRLSEYENKFVRQIESGRRKPTCSNECSVAYARRHINKERTSIERKMAEELSRRAIEYIEQYNLGNKFSLDFLLPEYGIVIECDGDYWHSKPEVMRRDRAKNAYIRACGYTLFRFWEREINECVEACVDVVLAEINARDAV